MPIAATTSTNHAHGSSRLRRDGFSAVSVGEASANRAVLPLSGMPLVGMGTAVRSKAQLLGMQDSVSAFLAAGGRLIDTAPTYGSGKLQALLAEPMSRWPRGELWLTSKIPVPSSTFLRKVPF